MVDLLVQPKRDRFAAIRFFRKLLKHTKRQPRVIITDKLRSYGAAKRVVLPRVAHRQSRYLNNRAENSHQPTRERERRMKRFNHRSRHNVFSRCRASWRLISDPSGIYSVLRSIEGKETNDLRFGRK